MYPGMCQGGVIWGGEGVELLGVYLGRTVAPVQFVLEIKAYFLYNGLPVGIAQCSQFYGRPMGSCEPVNMTGLRRPENMKLSAEVV